MPASQLQLRIEVETQGADQLTALRTQLDRLGAAGSDAFAGLDISLAAVLDKLKLSRGLLAATTRSFLDSQRQLLAGLTPLLDSFFHNLLAGSRATSGALKRVWRDLLDFFVGVISRMVTSWMTGQRQMSAVTGGGGLLGGIFGLPFLGTSGGTRGAANLALAAVSTGLALAGAGVRRGNVGLGAFGGFQLGGIAGGLIGGLLSVFSRGRLRRNATAIADQGFGEMRRVVQEFERFRVDFESALAQVTSIWQGMVGAWSGLGGIGRRSIRSQQPQFDAVLRRLRQIEQVRQQRAQFFATLPEFQMGGLVRAISASDGRVLALLHAGEAVLNRRAVAALGERQVERFNREPSRSIGTRGDEFFITINAVDGESVERWLSKNEARLVRFLRRAARDRGLPPPV